MIGPFAHRVDGVGERGVDRSEALAESSGRGPAMRERVSATGFASVSGLIGVRPSVASKANLE
jgi:hypothetical protein